MFLKLYFGDVIIGVRLKKISQYKLWGLKNEYTDCDKSFLSFNRGGSWAADKRKKPISKFFQNRLAFIGKNTYFVQGYC
jgi:hypothetical protein